MKPFPPSKWRDHAAIAGLSLTSYRELEELVAREARRLRQAGVSKGRIVFLQEPNSPKSIIRLLAVWQLNAVACPLSTRWPRRLGRQAIAQVEQVGRLPEIDGEAPATIVFTTGSTGRPKAVLHTLANHLASASAAQPDCALRPGDRWLLSLPLYHVGGLAILFRCLLHGAAIALPTAQQQVAWPALRRRITHLSLVPTQLQRLIRRGPPPPSLRYVLVGGGPLAPTLGQAAKAIGWPIHPSFGMTETCSQVMNDGRPLPNVEIHLDKDGQLLVRGPMVARHYLDYGNRPAILNAAGWLATGDLARRDAEGRLQIIGRKDNRFVSGGENVQPEQIETALKALPAVIDAVVVPVPDAEFGQRPAAFLRTRGGLHENSIKTALRKCLPGFMVPDRFLEWPGEARLTLNKPDRNWLRALAIRRNV